MLAFTTNMSLTIGQSCYQSNCQRGTHLCRHICNNLSCSWLQASLLNCILRKKIATGLVWLSINNLERAGDDVGHLPSRLLLGVQFPPLVRLPTQISLTVRLLDRPSSLRGVPGDDRGPGWGQDSQRMVCQAAARGCWTWDRRSPPCMRETRMNLWREL